LAQSGSITIMIDCGNPESITVDNDTDATLVLQSLNSSENQTSENEIDLEDAEVAAGASTTVDYGSSGGEGNIFNNEEIETATVTISDNDYSLTCNMGNVAEKTFPFDGPDPGPTPTPTSPPTDESTPTPDEATPTPDMPNGMGDSGGGGMAGGAGLPVAPIAGFLALLAASGYAVLRRR